MWQALVRLKHEPSSMIEQREHDRAVEAARDTSLPDGCSAQDFSDKVNMLMEQHIPYCERKYEGEALSTYIIDLMPKAIESDKWALIDKLTAEKTLAR